jgi:murein DD-endopeptidase MepM/ murein hydrolase activator NlpD
MFCDGTAGAVWIMLLKTLRAILYWLGVSLVLLACNFPAYRSDSAGGTAGEQFRQTLEASRLLTTTPAPEATPVPGVEATAPATPVSLQTPLDPSTNAYSYQTRSGDTARALAARFAVGLEQVPVAGGLYWDSYLEPGQVYAFPRLQTTTTPDILLLPDSELVYSPTAAEFDTAAFVQAAGGYLSSYQEEVDGTLLTGAEIIQRVADELSVNPRLLLALLEVRAGWVFGQPLSPNQVSHPIGFYIPQRSGLYQEIQVAATQLNVGYYGWRDGTKLTIQFQDGGTARLSPVLNAGTVAVQHLFALLIRQSEWSAALYDPAGFGARYLAAFGDPWERDREIGALLPHDLVQPELELPFAAGERWSLTAGPHPAWNAGTPRGALDFSPVTGEPVCAISSAWVTASAPGVVVPSPEHAVILDLDGDGRPQTGWVLLYYHLAGTEVAPPGARVDTDDPLGHPSCLGGRATGKHVHFARRYNGEWLPADGALPFTVSGWQAQADERNYYGSLIKGQQVVSANPSGSQTSIIVR